MEAKTKIHSEVSAAMYYQIKEILTPCIAETIIKNTSTKNQKLLKLDSMQAVNAERIAAGETYLSIMEYNLAVLKDALQ